MQKARRNYESTDNAASHKDEGCSEVVGGKPGSGVANSIFVKNDMVVCFPDDTPE